MRDKLKYIIHFPLYMFKSKKGNDKKSLNNKKNLTKNLSEINLRII